MAAIRGKQRAVEEGAFLKFLRSVGYREELPPSTVAWLESAPVFKFLAGRLSADNFVTPAEQQEYNEVMLARGPHADLYAALGSASSDDGEGGDEGTDAAQAAGGDQGWMGQQPESHLQWEIQAREAEVQQLEQQVATLKALAAQLELAVTEQRSSRAPAVSSAQGSAAQQLAAAKADAGRANSELNGVLQGLAQVTSALAGLLLERPDQWLLAATDLADFNQQNGAALAVISRLMTLMNVDEGGGCRDDALRPTHLRPAAAAAPGDNGRAGKQRPGALQVQQADARRHADEEAANAGLLRELKRQRLAFKLVLEGLVKAQTEAAGAQSQLAAAQHVKAGTGGWANHRQKGQASLALLAAELSRLERTKQQLERQELPAQIDLLARLNDTPIMAAAYDQTLGKMAAQRERKQAVLGSLVGMCSRQLLLLLLTSQEHQRLLGLGQQLSDAAQQLEGHTSNTRSRTNRCIAAGHSLQEAQQRGILQPDDAYLLAMMAAAQGALAADEGTSTAPAAAAAASGMALTPGRGGGGGGSTKEMPVRLLTEQLQGLASGAAGGASALQELLLELPQQLGAAKEAARQLHLLAFPPDQQEALQAVAAAAAAAASGSSKGDGGSSSYAPSLATSLASTSRRSGGSSSSTQASSGGAALLQAALQAHPLPLLRLPEVAEAAAAAEAGVGVLSKDIMRLVMRQNEAARLQGSNRPDAVLERSVMGLFFSRPAELLERVRQLREEVAALELAQELEQEQQKREQ